MLRVSKDAVVVISSGTPDRRMVAFEEFLEGRFSSIEHHQLETSQLAQLINILRTDLKNKPLSYAIKEDPAVLKRALLEMQRIKKERELAEGAKTDPRMKLLLLMMKARHMKLRQAEEAEAVERQRVKAEKEQQEKRESSEAVESQDKGETGNNSNIEGV